MKIFFCIGRIFFRKNLIFSNYKYLAIGMINKVKHDFSKSSEINYKPTLLEAQILFMVS